MDYYLVALFALLASQTELRNQRVFDPPKGAQMEKVEKEKRVMFPLRLTPTEKAKLEAAAQAEGLPLTQWIRRACLKAAARKPS